MTTSDLPNKPQYGSADILAPNVSWWNNRADYLAASGQQAPAFMAGMPVKCWVAAGLDLSNPSATYTFKYLGLDANGNAALLTMTISAAVAATLNMPGVAAFQSYADWLASRAPSKGTIEYRFFGTDLVNPMDVSTLFTIEEANRLAMELNAQTGSTWGAVALTAPDGNATAQYNYDPADPRRIFDLRVSVGPGKDQMFAMGGATGLFALRSSLGVGHPGTWSWTTIPDPTDPSGLKQVPNYAAGPRWTGSAVPDGSTEARVFPVPVRDLLSPPEKLVVLRGNVVVVQRTDLLQPATGGGFTDAQAAAIALIPDIQTKVSRIVAALPPAQ